jgi:hypothetical protein
MHTVPAKKPASHVPGARALAIDLVAYMRGSAPRCSVIRDKEAVLVERLLDEACAAAGRELDADERRARDILHGSPELVAGAKLGPPEPCPTCRGVAGAVESCPVCRGRGRMVKPNVVGAAPSVALPGLIRELPQRIAEAERERDEARAERDKLHDRCRELEADRAQLRRENEEAWSACPHFPSGANVSTLPEAIAFFRGELAQADTAQAELVDERVGLRATLDEYKRSLGRVQCERDQAIADERTMYATLTGVQTRCTELRAELEALRAGAAS